MRWLADPTLQTVLAGALILGLASGVLGAFAVLRRQSLMGDVLAHAALPGICLGFLVAGGRQLESLLAGAFLAATAAALLVLAIARGSRLKPDAALGIVLGVFFAAGVVLLSYAQTRSGAAQAGLSSFLFGQAAAILRADLWVIGCVAAVALAVIAALWKEFKLVAFDPGFAAAAGLPVLALEVALTVMIALAVVVGLQMVGVVLMTAMLIAPAAAARQWTRRLEGMVALSVAFAVIAGGAGAIISAGARGLATGPLIVLAATAIFVVSLLFAPGRGLVTAFVAYRREARALRGRRVLRTLAQLARNHDDPDHASEQGMVDAYHGTATGPALRRLEGRGLVALRPQGLAATPHWALTRAGHAEAGRAPDGSPGAPPEAAPHDGEREC